MATPSRSEDVVVLGDTSIDYKDYGVVCRAVVSKWLHGDLGDGAPTEGWDKEMVKKVINYRNEEQSMDKKKCKEISDKLIEILVINHLKIVTSHRLWVRNVFRFMRKADVLFEEGVEEQVQNHDLSKYEPEEVLGYALKFGQGKQQVRELEGEKGKEWMSAYNHHLSYNRHHPEFFDKDPKHKTVSMVTGPNGGKCYLEESLLDMLACRGERNLQSDQTFSVTKWVELDVKFLQRYTESDRNAVKELLKEWTKKAKKYVRNLDNNEAQSIRELFGGKEVTV